VSQKPSRRDLIVHESEQEIRNQSPMALLYRGEFRGRKGAGKSGRINGLEGETREDEVNPVYFWSFGGIGKAFGPIA